MPKGNKNKQTYCESRDSLQTSRRAYRERTMSFGEIKMNNINDSLAVLFLLLDVSLTHFFVLLGFVEKNLNCV